VTSGPSVRIATESDGAEVRSLVTRAILAAGLAAPEPELDADLVDLSYYATNGRALWVAERDGVIVGCAAIDHGEPGIAILRRLAGGGLDALVSTAIEFAALQDASVVETVLPPGLPGTRDALARADFQHEPDASELLLRRVLR